MEYLYIINTDAIFFAGRDERRSELLLFYGEVIYEEWNLGRYGQTLFVRVYPEERDL